MVQVCSPTSWPLIKAPTIISKGLGYIERVSTSAPYAWWPCLPSIPQCIRALVRISTHSFYPSELHFGSHFLKIEDSGVGYRNHFSLGVVVKGLEISKQKVQYHLLECRIFPLRNNLVFLAGHKIDLGLARAI